MDTWKRWPNTPTTPLGRYLRDTRRAAGITQVELAQRTGLSQASISTWENGTRIPKATAMAALARALPKVTVARLIELVGEGTDQ